MRTESIFSHRAEYILHSNVEKKEGERIEGNDNVSPNMKG